MDELQELFGEESLSYADFTARLNERGIKLANVRAGGYVDKGKYDKLAGEYAKYKQENDVSKYADYDTLKAELEKLKAEKEEAEYMANVAEARVDARFQRFVVSEVKPLVSDKKDFKTCLGEYLKENPQFVENAQRRGVIRSGSQVSLDEGSGAGAKNINQKMNDFIRGARN